MSEHAESSLHVSQFDSLVHLRRRGAIRFVPHFAPPNPSKKHSVIACAYLLAYLGAYLAVGFAAVAGIGWLWAQILR